MSPGTEPAVVSLESLWVRYGRTAACADISLAVERGEVYALLGRNGAGKSSLVRCLLGQQKPSAGRASLFGEDSWKRRARLMARVGVVPEEPDAPPALTAWEILDFCRRLYPVFNRKAADHRLVRFGVPRDVAFSRLSRGQKTQVLLAAALGPGPELLMLDDPTLGLDPVARNALFEELIGELADRGTTVLITTHDLAGIERIASRIGILKNGRLALDEEMETLKSRFRRIRYGNEIAPARAAYGDELDAFDAVRVQVRGWGIDAVVSNYDELAFERFRQIPGVVDAEVSGMSLEEIFLAVAGEPAAAVSGEARAAGRAMR